MCSKVRVIIILSDLHWFFHPDAYKLCIVFIEIGVNGQTTAKTALHTSNQCDMYAHVAPYAKTGDWEWISKFASLLRELYCVTFANCSQNSLTHITFSWNPEHIYG